MGRCGHGMGGLVGWSARYGLLLTGLVIIGVRPHAFLPYKPVNGVRPHTSLLQRVFGRICIVYWTVDVSAARRRIRCSKEFGYDEMEDNVQYRYDIRLFCSGCGIRVGGRDAG